MKVRLEEYERKQAILCGKLRHISSWGKHKNKYGDPDETEQQSLSKHVYGAGAELAVAKLTNRYWHASVDTFNKGADVGERIQVRRRSKPHYDLIVRKHDKDDHYFFLVYGTLKEYDVVGWILAKDGKKDEFKESYGKGKEAYFVPRGVLYPYGGHQKETIDELPPEAMHVDWWLERMDVLVTGKELGDGQEAS